MKHKYIYLLLLVLLNLNFIHTINAQTENNTNHMESSIAENEKLVVLWTSGDKEVAMKMVFMYTFNAKKNGWWKDITLIIWGPSAKLLSEDKDIQAYIKKMDETGIHLLACKGCADLYNVSETLEKLGVSVKYIGVELTEIIKSERHLITF